jgi:hypothetical protein
MKADCSTEDTEAQDKTHLISLWRQIPPWRVMWPSPMGQSLCMLAIAMAVLPYVPAWADIVLRSYPIFLALSSAVIVCFGARAWLVWLVTTLLWSLGWLILCLWQLAQLVGASG